MQGSMGSADRSMLGKLTWSQRVMLPLGWLAAVAACQDAAALSSWSLQLITIQGCCYWGRLQNKDPLSSINCTVELFCVFVQGLSWREKDLLCLASLPAMAQKVEEVWCAHCHQSCSSCFLKSSFWGTDAFLFSPCKFSLIYTACFFTSSKETMHCH